MSTIGERSFYTPEVNEDTFWYTKIIYMKQNRRIMKNTGSSDRIKKESRALDKLFSYLKFPETSGDLWHKLFR